MNNFAQFSLHPDPLGLAYESYFSGNSQAEFILFSDMFDPDAIPVEYFFRTYEQMPFLEKEALAQCKGSVLDVGAGTGLHSIYLQEQGYTVTALDISPLAVDIMKKRGVRDVVCEDFWKFSHAQYDTLLFLMNGIGLISSIDNFPDFFAHASQLLKPGGQILLDSSDLKYLFEEEDGSFLIPLQETYYGQVDFRTAFETYISEPYFWVYVDFETLRYAAEQSGFTCVCIAEGNHYDYTARITRK